MNIETPLHILIGNCLTTLKELPAASVQTCVTSPPYYGLRDYGTAEWEGGDSACDHTVSGWNDNLKPNVNRPERDGQKRKRCLKCGARRIDQQIGLEETPDAYIQKLLLVFGEVWRVLKPDGTLWVNLGDSYAGSGGAGGWNIERGGTKDNPNRNTFNGIKQKDLIGIPWAFAFAMRAAGWYLRSDIIWHKPNPMPESVTDRPTKAHEYIFLFSKSAKYYYDYEAVLEEATGYDGRKDTEYKGGPKDMAGGAHERWSRSLPGTDRKNHKNIETEDQGRRPHSMHMARANGEGDPEAQTKDGVPARNKRSVWTVSTKPYAGAHFATFPPDLIEPCILAGTSEKGECPECGKAYKRLMEIETNTEMRNKAGKNDDSYQRGRVTPRGAEVGDFHDLGSVSRKFLGWEAQCSCSAGDPIPQTVLDPFGGSGTTAQVSIENNRHAILCELNQEYIPLIKERCGQLQRVLF